MPFSSDVKNKTLCLGLLLLEQGSQLSPVGLLRIRWNYILLSAHCICLGLFLEKNLHFQFSTLFNYAFLLWYLFEHIDCSILEHRMSQATK